MPKKHRRTFQHNGERIEKTFSRKADADEWYAQMKRSSERARAGMPLALDSTLVKVYCASWIMLRKNKSNEWKTEESRLRKHILPRIGEKSLRFISKHDIETALHEIRVEQGFSHSTFNRYRTLLHKIFEDACKDGYREENPVSRVERYSENFEAPVATDEELEAYLKEAKKYPGFFQYVVAGMNCGPRPGETIAWKWMDIRPDLSLILINRRFVRSTGKVLPGTKGKRNRYVPLNTTLSLCLAQWRSVCKFNKPDDFIFHREDGSIASINTYNNIHKRVRRAAGIRKEVRLYDLTRHAYATRLSQKGNMRLVQVILGHTDSKTTERYAHNDPSFVQRGADLEIGAEVVKLQ